MARIWDDKGRPVDATFHVERLDGRTTISLESRGPDRNVEYAKGLDLLLQRLAQLQAVLSDVQVASTVAQDLPAPERRVEPDGYEFPLELAGVDDYAALRQALGRAMAQVGRAPNAGGPGNATKKIRLYVDISPLAAADSVALAERLGRTRSHFAVLANPSIYDVERASLELTEDTWGLPYGDVHTGDRFAIWRTSDAEGHRGIVAFGEVLEDPRPMEEASESSPYWLSRPSHGSSRRFRFKYVAAPYLPLWIDEDDSGLLQELTVSRAQGTKAYRITHDQWDRLIDRAGGWSIESAAMLEPDKATLEEEARAQDEIRNDRNISETERKALIDARRGQGRFRRDVLAIQPRCRVTGIGDTRLLVASHIWPWSKSSNEERLDPYNGFMLAAHIDRLFDKGLISFADNGIIMCSPDLDEETRKLLGLPAEVAVGTFTDQHKAYLSLHRAHVVKPEFFCNLLLRSPLVG